MQHEQVSSAFVRRTLDIDCRLHHNGSRTVYQLRFLLTGKNVAAHRHNQEYHRPDESGFLYPKAVTEDIKR